MGFGAHFGKHYQKSSKGASNSPHRANARLSYLNSLRQLTKQKRRFVFELGVCGSVITSQEMPITASIRRIQEVTVTGKVVQNERAMYLNGAVRDTLTLKLRSRVYNAGRALLSERERKILLRKLSLLLILHKAAGK